MYREAFILQTILKDVFRVMWFMNLDSNWINSV